MEKQKKLEYKWVVVAACFLMIFTCLGFCSSVRPLVLRSVTNALEVDRSLYALVDTCRYVTTAIVNVFFGVLVMRFGARKLIAAGFFSLFGSAMCYVLAPNVYVLYLGGVLLGLGFSWTTTTMVGFVINKWCKKNKGTIMGAVLAANGLGGALSAQILTPIIENGVQGYRNAYFVIAAILLVVGTLVVLFIREAPKYEEDAEQQATPTKKRRGEGWIGVESSVVLKKSYTWLMLGCIFLCGLTLNGISGISAAYMRDQGLDPSFVATVVSIHSLTLAGFKFLSGFLYDRFGLRVTVGISTLTGVGVMVALASVTNTVMGMVLAVIYGVFSSLALPLETVMLPIFANDLFGERSYNKMLGIIVSVNTAGYAVGSLFMNICYDLMGSYYAALLLSACLMLLVAFTSQLAIGLAHNHKKKILAELGVKQEAAVL